MLRKTRSSRSPLGREPWIMGMMEGETDTRTDVNLDIHCTGLGVDFSARLRVRLHGGRGQGIAVYVAHQDLVPIPCVASWLARVWARP